MDRRADGLKKGFEQLKADAIEYLDELILSVTQKDTIINEKDNTILSLMNELNMIKSKNVELETKLSEAIDKKIKNEVILITSPEQIFRYENYIIKRFFGALNWDKTSIKGLFKIIRESIKTKYFDITDKAIVTLADCYIKSDRITSSDWEEVLNLFISYINEQTRIKEYKLDGIFYFIRIVNDMRHTELLKPFIEAKGTIIQEIIIEKPDNNSIKYVVMFLKACSLLFSREKVAVFIDKFLDCKLIIKDSLLDTSESMELLLIALYCERDGKLIDNKSIHDEIKLKQIPEANCYLTYYDTLNGLITLNVGIEKIKSIEKYMIHVDPRIRDKVVTWMENKLNKKCKKTVSVKNMKKNIEVKKSRPVTASNDTEVRFIDSRKKPNVIKTTFNAKKNNIKPKGVYNVNSPIRPQHIIFSTPEPHSNQNSANYEDKLKPESELKKMGYEVGKTTTLTRQQRWDILYTKAVPQLGLRKVVSLIRWFISGKKNHENGSQIFQYSISEWEYDLKKLNEKFGAL